MAADYFKSPCGVAKIGIMIMCVGEASIACDLYSNTGYLGAWPLKPICGGPGCGLKQDGCPSQKSATFGIFGIAVPTAICTIIAPAALMFFFEKITTNKFFYPVEVIAFLIAALLQLIFANICYEWARKAKSKHNCRPKQDIHEDIYLDCIKELNDSTNPNLFQVLAAMAFLCCIAFLVACLFIALKLTSPPAPAQPQAQAPSTEAPPAEAPPTQA